MDENQKSKRYLHFITFLSIFLALFGFGFIIMGAVLQSNGYDTAGLTLMILLGFFVCEIIAIVLLVGNIKHFIANDLAVKTLKYDKAELTVLENMTSERIREQFIRKNFKEMDNDYLRKKVFSFAKDSVCYYVRTANAQQITSTIGKELMLFDSVKDGSKNICLLLFVFKAGLCDADFAALRYVSQTLIIKETLVPVQHFHTAVTVLVDSETGKGYYLDIHNRFSISIYAHGCRLLKKYFSRQ